MISYYTYNCSSIFSTRSKLDHQIGKSSYMQKERKKLNRWHEFCLNRFLLKQVHCFTRSLKLTPIYFSFSYTNRYGASK